MYNRNKLKYLKFLDADGRGPYSGFKWPIGKWVKTEGRLEMCRNGIHVTTLDCATKWIHARCHPVQIRGGRLGDNHKLCVRSARLGPVFETWNDRTARLFAADCAEHVLYIFERHQPSDTRPRDAIEVARKFANGEVAPASVRVAWTAARNAAGPTSGTAVLAAADAAAGAASAGSAWVAAENVTGDAVWATAESAIEDVVRTTTVDAAEAAAANAERRWQSERLVQYLTGEVG